MDKKELLDKVGRRFNIEFGNTEEIGPYWEVKTKSGEEMCVMISFWGSLPIVDTDMQWAIAHGFSAELEKLAEILPEALNIDCGDASLYCEPFGGPTSWEKVSESQLRATMERYEQQFRVVLQRALSGN